MTFRRVGSLVGLAILRVLVAMPSRNGTAAQLQDVQAILNQRLATKGHVTRQREIQREEEVCDWFCCHHGCDADCYRCRKERKPAMETYTTAPTLAGLEIRSVSTLRVDTARATKLPERIHRKEIVFVNCSKTEQTYTQGFSMTVTMSESATMTKSVANGLSITGRADWDFGPYGKYGISITGSKTVTITDSSTQMSSTTETHQFSVPLKVQPGNVGTGALWVFLVSMEAPFSGSIVFDGPITPNMEGISRASQLLSEPERTIAVEGVLAVTSGSQAYNGIWEEAARLGECGGAPTGSTRTEVREFEGAPGTKSTAMNPYRGLERAVLAQIGLAADGGALKRRPTKARGLGGSAESPKKREGTPGDYCFIGACNRPLDGYRQVCRYDADGACTDCYEEADPICDPGQEAVKRAK